MKSGPVGVTLAALNAVGGFAHAKKVVEKHLEAGEEKSLWLYKGWKILVHTRSFPRLGTAYTRVMLWEERSNYKL